MSSIFKKVNKNLYQVYQNEHYVGDLFFDGQQWLFDPTLLSEMLTIETMKDIIIEAFTGEYSD